MACALSTLLWLVQFFKGYKLGYFREIFGRIITEIDVITYYKSNSRFFPSHMDVACYKSQPFKQPITHGILMFSLALGTRIAQINPEAFQKNIIN